MPDISQIMGNDLIAKSSNSLIQSVKTLEQTPYQLRQTPITANRTLEKLIGVSCAFNQLVQNGNFENTSNWTNGNSSLAVNNNVGTFTVINVGDVYCETGYVGAKDHCYLLRIFIKIPTTISGSFGLRSFYNGVANSKTIAGIKDGTYHEYSMIIKETTGGLYNRLRIYGNSNAVDDYCELQKANIIDLTACFGSEVADYLYNLENG